MKPTTNECFRWKYQMLENALNEFRVKLGNHPVEKIHIESTMDFLLRREILQARKENKLSRLVDVVLKDDLFGFC